MSYDFSKVRLYICTPCYGGMVTSEYAQSMIRLCTDLYARGIDYRYHTLSNDSLVTRARACLLAQFMGDPLATHMLFVDADISFHINSVYRLLAEDKEVIGGVYPMKSVDWEAVRTAIIENPNIPEPELIHRSAKYVFNIQTHETHGVEGIGKVTQQGFVRVSDLGTGFLMVQRRAFERMNLSLEDPMYKCDIPSLMGKPAGDNMALHFDTELTMQRRYLSEDYAFCQKWISIGGEVWADLMSPLHHRGNFVFQGRPIDTYQKHIKANHNG